MGEEPLTFEPGMLYIKPIDAPDSEYQELEIASSKDIHFDVGAPEGDFSVISMPMEFKFEGTLKLSEHQQKVWAYMMKGPTPWLIYAKRYPRKLKKHYKRIIEASAGNKVVFKYAFKHHDLLLSNES